MIDIKKPPAMGNRGPYEPDGEPSYQQTGARLQGHREGLTTFDIQRKLENSSPPQSNNEVSNA